MKPLRITTTVLPTTTGNYCINEHGQFKYADIWCDWRCPVCKSYLRIGVWIKDEVYSCERVLPCDLRTYEIVTLDNKYMHTILNIEKEENEFKIALEKYRLIIIDHQTQVTRITGSWYPPYNTNP